MALAVQAPTGSNSQNWHFVIVTDPQQRQSLGDLYRKGYALYRQRVAAGQPVLVSSAPRPEQEATLTRVRDSSAYLAAHLHEVPVLVVPCIEGRVEGLPPMEQATVWGSILSATWSFMLAARAHGLGTCWTTVHLYYEQEAAEVLGIPYERVTQAALIAVAYTVGTDFQPAPRG